MRTAIESLKITWRLNDYSHPQLAFLHFPFLHFPKFVHSKLALRGQFTARPKQKKPSRNNGRIHHPNVVMSIPPFKSVTTAATRNTIPTLANAGFRIHAMRIHRPHHVKINEARSPATHGALGSTHHHRISRNHFHAKSIVTHKKKIIVPHPNLAILIPRRSQLLHSVAQVQLILMV